MFYARGPTAHPEADSGRQQAAARRQGSKQAGNHHIRRHPLVLLPLRLLATFMILTTAFKITVTPTTVHDKLRGDVSESFAMYAVYVGFRRQYATLAHPNLSVKKGSSWVRVQTPALFMQPGLNSKVRIAGKEICT